MQENEVNIESVVRDVVAKLEDKSIATSVPVLSGESLDMDTLLERSRAAQVRYQQGGLDLRYKVVAAMRAVARENAEMLGNIAVSETTFGKMPDKMQKVLLAADKTPGPEDLFPRTFTGDHGLTLEELAPYGVVGSIIPSTNPPSTVVNNAISVLSAGNSIVFHPHPAAVRVSEKTVAIMQEAVIKAGGPDNLIMSVPNPTKESAQQFMKHKLVDLLVVTGGSAVVDLAMSSSKKAICAGPGNPPVVVDETANIDRAAQNIVNGGSFDNGVLCTAEKEVFVVEQVADRLIRAMRHYGAFQLGGDDAARLKKLVIAKDPGGKGERHPVVNTKYVGKNASVLLNSIGIDAPKDTKMVIFEALWDDPMVMAEQLTPFMPIVRVPNVQRAMELAVIAEHNFRHTFIMHSINIENLSRMAQLCKGNIFVKNGPSYAGLGFGGEGHTTLTIAGTTGEGLTTARSFARPRRCTLVDYFRIV